MVDAVVSFVVDRLGNYLIQEAFSFNGGVTSEVVSLKKQLEWMLCFIKYAEEKQVDNAMIKKCVEDIRDIAYDTEDVLDTFMLDFHDKGPSKIRQIFASITNWFGLFVTESSLYTYGSENVSRYSICKEIATLRKRIDDIYRTHESYGIEKFTCNNCKGTNSEGRGRDLETLRQLRKATSFAVEENVVGLEDDARELLDKLLKETPSRSVISIFGTGGLGKTTFARKLYHNNDVKKKFDCCAWVCVSQDYKARDLLLRITKSFKMRVAIEHLERMSEEDLERYLHCSLQERTYLLVIDDVWKREVWQSLKRAFPDNKNSCVVITTRIKDVAERSEEKTHVHKLRFLRRDESWNLFRQKAFGDSHIVDKGLETSGREMVEKCGGLPLAIVVLAGLLSVKKPQEWDVVSEHIWRHLRDDSIEISYLLTLSFNDLSYQLKLCFLYLGLFPEDFEISVEKLIRQWVAEGFIVENDDRIMEEVAMDNLEELIDRSLIQVERRYHGRVETCRVHDLLRDLTIEMAKELNFIHIIDESSHSSCSSNKSSCRREAVYFDMEWCMWLQHCTPRSRSLWLFIPDWYSFKDLSTPICTRFRLLRVLHIESCRGSFGSRTLPKEIGQLTHLKYLALRNTGIRNLPPSIFFLRSLQTLDLHSFNCDLTLPYEICKLQELRHLIASIKGSLPIENLTNLQTLNYVKYESWARINPDRLVNLRELTIDSYVRRGHKSFVFKSIGKLRSLRILRVKLLGDYSFSSLQPLSHCSHLIDLSLNGKIQKLSEFVHVHLKKLECLSLRNSRLEADPMPMLEKLPNLIYLQLNNTHGQKKMICTGNGFPRLEILELLHLDELEEWQVEEGAMRLLRGLKIEPRSSNLRIPERLEQVLF